MKIHPHSMLLQEFAETLDGEYRSLLAHALRCSDCQGDLLQLLAQPRIEPIPEKLAKVLAWGQPAAGRAQAGSAGSAGQDAGIGNIVTIAHTGEDRHERAFATREYERRRALFEREQKEAPQLFTEISEQPPIRRVLLLRNQRRFHTWGFFELLLEKGREASYTDPPRSEELAWLALSIGDELDASLYGALRIEDLRGRAWAYIGNARRVRSDLDGAESAFEQAFHHLRRGTRESLDRAVVLDLKASLLRARRHFDDAIRLLRRAYHIFRQFEDHHRAGRVLVNLSTVCHSAGKPEEAIPLLQEALDLLDFDEEPRLRLIVVHNLLDDLAETGRFMEARELFLEARPLYERFPDASTRNRRQWVEGKIARGLGQRAQAEELWTSARDGFVEEGIPYDAALVSLDLAALYAEKGATAELKRLSQEMLVIFRSQQIHREALAALSYLQQALEAERATLELIRRIALYLKRAETDPGLRFDPAAAL
jgi:tetratricopeptide (TPR) repeat protein